MIIWVPWVIKEQVDIENWKGCSLFRDTGPWPLHQHLWYITILLKIDIDPLLNSIEKILILLTFIPVKHLTGKYICKSLSKSVHFEMVITWMKTNEISFIFHRRFFLQFQLTSEKSFM